MRKTKRVLFWVAAVLVVAGAVSWFVHNSRSESTVFRTALVQRGDVVATISASGTVEPEEVVDVGAQVAGKIVAFGKDENGKPVDYDSQVQQGTVLAQIDDSLYAADVSISRAQLQQAEGGVLKAEADLDQLRANLTLARRNWLRAKQLGPSDALSRSDYDAANSAYEVAQANLEVGKAVLIQAQNSVLQAQANLHKAQQNLDYCTIKSPVKGIIIDRRVNIGQTVVSSLNAPSLFLIAKDLTHMQVWVPVNEADIGKIHRSQTATFTVDAFPGQVFQGIVGKVRLNAQMTQNIVTYTVEVNTDNSDGRLLPYLTANVKFLLGQSRDALLVPNAALRWMPRLGQVAPASRKLLEQAFSEPNPGDSGAAATDVRSGSGEGLVWVRGGDFVHPVRVHTGWSDGIVTAVRAADLLEGVEVVLGEQSREAAGEETKLSPFTPRFHRSRSQKPR